MTFPNAKQVHSEVIAGGDMLQVTRKALLDKMKSQSAMRQAYDSTRGCYRIQTPGRLDEMGRFTITTELSQAGWMVVSFNTIPGNGPTEINTMWEIKPA